MLAERIVQLVTSLNAKLQGNFWAVQLKRGSKAGQAWLSCRV